MIRTDCDRDTYGWDDDDPPPRGIGVAPCAPGPLTEVPRERFDQESGRWVPDGVRHLCPDCHIRYTSCNSDANWLPKP